MRPRLAASSRRSWSKSSCCGVGQNTSEGQLSWAIRRLVTRRMIISALRWASHPPCPIRIHPLSTDRRRSSDGLSRRARALSTTAEVSSAAKMLRGSGAMHATLPLRKA